MPWHGPDHGYGHQILRENFVFYYYTWHILKKKIISLIVMYYYWIFLLKRLIILDLSKILDTYWACKAHSLFSIFLRSKRIYGAWDWEVRCIGFRCHLLAFGIWNKFDLKLFILISICELFLLNNLEDCFYYHYLVGMIWIYIYIWMKWKTLHILWD